MEPSHTPPGRSAAAVLVAVLAAPGAFALNPLLDISQYEHTSWKLDSGFVKGAVHCIAQTPDGFIWLGTEFGLVRFDGVKAVEWPIGQLPPATQIRTLIAARDGTLWLGTSKGLVSIKKGKGAPYVHRYAELDGQTIFGLVEDRDGRVWAAGWSPTKSMLCAIGNGCVPFDGRDATFGGMIGNAYRDLKDNIWVGTPTGVWRWSPGPPKFFSLPGRVVLMLWPTTTTARC
jgi:ligand-binding sensor domain-containing protein